MSGVMRLLATASVLWTTWNTMHGQDAAGLHGQVAEEHAQQAGDQRLLQDAVGQAEEQRADRRSPAICAPGAGSRRG